MISFLPAVPGSQYNFFEPEPATTSTSQPERPQTSGVASAARMFHQVAPNSSWNKSIAEYRREADGSSYLHTAVLKCGLRVVQRFVEIGSNVNARTFEGKTPLHVAASIENAGAEEVEHKIKYLISQGADINARDKKGMTPLHSAADFDNTDTMKYLVSEGADVNAREDRGITLLHIAAYTGDIDMVKYLIAKGACFEAVTYGKTPLDIALNREHAEVVEYLCEARSFLRYFD